MTSNVPALIVGGGISGLVCAYALRKAGVDAQLMEASARPGGVIRSERRQGYLLELGPQSFGSTAPVRTLCRELTVEDELVEAPPHAPRYVLIDGSLRPVPLNPRAFLTSSLFSPGTKASLAHDMFGKSRPPKQDESVASFVRRKFTAELLDCLIAPFVSGVYAGDPERLSLRSAFPQAHEAEESAGSVIRGMMRQARNRKESRQRPSLLSFREGNETLVRALATKLGSAFHAGTKVTGIELRQEEDKTAYLVSTSEDGQQDAILAEHLILATPTDVAGELLEKMRPGFAPLLGPIEYAPVAIVSLGYVRTHVGWPLDGFGFLVPRSERLRVLGTVWNSSLFPDRAPEGHVLMTSFVGGATDPQAMTLSPQDLIALVHRELTPVLAIHHPPAFSNAETYRRALPQYNLGHSERLAALEELRQESANLWLTGNYLRGPSIGACVDHAQAVAKDVLSRLQGQRGKLIRLNDFAV